jgi:hypothetical protein
VGIPVAGKENRTMPGKPGGVLRPLWAKALLALLLAVAAAAMTVMLLWPREPRYLEEARADVLKGITVDGKLDDWPEGMKSYAFKYRPGAEFRVAYDPDDNLLYVAVRVTDEDLVVGHNWRTTDACEVNVWGGGGPRPSSPMQFALVPGPGEYIAGLGNPTLNAGGKHLPANTTRTRAAFQYDGKVITYEWAVEVYDHHFDRPTRLSAGKQIGFDVVVVDRQSDGNRSWTPWGHHGVHKFERPGNLRKLELMSGQVQVSRGG